MRNDCKVEIAGRGQGLIAGDIELNSASREPFKSSIIALTLSMHPSPTHNYCLLLRF